MQSIPRPTLLGWLYNPTYKIAYEDLFEARCERAVELIFASNRNNLKRKSPLIIPEQATKALKAAISMKGLNSTIRYISDCEGFSKFERKILIDSILTVSKAA